MVSVRQPANEKVIGYLAQGRTVEDDRPPRSDRRDYWEAGSHPDIVERIWDQLGRALPPESKRVVCGSPVLLNPQSKVIVAVAVGTAYAIRLPSALLRSGVPSGLKTQTTWSGGRRMDVQEEFGDDWVFGDFSSREEAWCRESFDEHAAAGVSKGDDG